MTTMLILLAGLLLQTSPLVPVQTPVTMEGVCAAIGAGDIESLVSVASDELELSILDEENIYDRAAATRRLKTFYAGLGKTSFGKVHQGASKAEDAEYCIGTLTTQKSSYRVYVYVAKQGDGIVLQELRFDPN